MNPDFVTWTGLRQRGWTPSMIARFLADADTTRPNSHYRSAAPVKLYRVARVAAMEASPAFADAKDRATKRGAVSRISAQRRAEELKALVLEDVRVDYVPLSELRTRAIESRQAWYTWRRKYNFDSSEADEGTIERWMVNYARHELSNYDAVRVRYAGQVGVHDAAWAVRAAVMKRIAELWPSLAGEACPAAPA